MKYLNLLLILLLFISCKKEQPAPSEPDNKSEEVSGKVDQKPEEKQKEPLPKPTMDIFVAIDGENVEEIRRNIHHNKEVLTKLDSQGDAFPLHYAAYDGKFESLKTIADYCDVNLRCPDKDGTTALIYAARKGHLEIVKYLVGKGADVNIIFGKMENGKKVNSGYTALYASCIENHVDITEFLLENGADHSVLCKMSMDPKTALDIADANGSNLSKIVLQRHGAKTAKELLKK